MNADVESEDKYEERVESDEDEEVYDLFSVVVLFLIINV